MRALVTGATGFIGQHLCRHLLDNEWTVHALVRPESDIAALSILGPANVHRFAGGVEQLTDICATTRPDVVFHLASLFLAEHRPEQVEQLIAANVGFGTMLLEAMHLTGVTAFVNTGTFWQHFDDEPRGRPVNLYAGTKQAFEALLGWFCDVRGLRAVTLKLSDTYGPADARGKLISLLLRLAREGGGLGMSPGEQEIDIVHVDDVVRGFRIAAERCLVLPPGHNESYALSSGAPIPLRELVTLFEQATGRNLAIRWGERPYRTREVMHTWRGGVPLPGWTAEIDLVEGFRGLIDD